MDGYRLRDFLQRSGCRFEWVELGNKDSANVFMGRQLAEDQLPVCILPQGTVLYRPSLQELAQALEWFKSPKLPEYDLAIYGAGPAGLSAAVYGASEGLRAILIERLAVGGQAASTSRIENYLGSTDGISGWELARRARLQAQRFGAEIIVTEKCVAGAVEDRRAVGILASGERVGRTDARAGKPNVSTAPGAAGMGLVNCGDQLACGCGEDMRDPRWQGWCGSAT